MLSCEYWEQQIRTIPGKDIERNCYLTEAVAVQGPPGVYVQYMIVQEKISEFEPGIYIRTNINKIGFKDEALMRSFYLCVEQLLAQVSPALFPAEEKYVASYNLFMYQLYATDVRGGSIISLKPAIPSHRDGTFNRRWEFADGKYLPKGIIPQNRLVLPEVVAFVN